MREVDRWFTELITLRTGWSPGEVFTFDDASHDSINLIPPVCDFSPEQCDLASMIKRPVLDDRGCLLVDLSGLAAWSLGRIEEHGLSDWNYRKKFAYQDALATRQGVSQKPFVDLLIENFIDDLIRLRDLKGKRTPTIKRPWPDGKKAAVCFSHDVDLLDGLTLLSVRRAFWLVMLLRSAILKKSDDRKIWSGRLQNWRKGGDDPVWCIPDWVRLEKANGIRSTFYFFGLSVNFGIEGRIYRSEHPHLIESLELLAAEGFEIGLHPGKRFVGMPDNVKRQYRRLNKAAETKVRTIRNHHLNFRLPASWAMADEIGLSTMSNIGWDGGDNGFRSGTCWPYRPADIPGIDIGGRLVEVPFQLLDRPRLDDVDDYCQKAFDLLSEAKAVGGAFVLDFHPHNMNAVEAPGVHEAFLRIMNKIVEDSDFWIAPVSEVAGAVYPDIDRK